MQIGIGVIGLGGIAGGVHLPGIAKCKDLKLTAICDVDQKKLEACGERYNIDPSRRFTDYHELIACKDVEAVDICTPNNFHFQIAMDAAGAGKP
jgi:predicted dehydrogenase